VTNADRLSVDLDGLEEFAGRLRSIRDRMNGTPSMIDGYAGDLGSGAVADALHRFERTWKDGRKQIDQCLDGLAKMAEQAVREIRKADAELKKKLTESTEEV
jgi:hypothetical protein